MQIDLSNIVKYDSATNALTNGATTVLDIDTITDNLLTYDTATGQIEYDAAAITGIASMTFAQMQELTAEQLLALAGMPIHISDVHTNSSGIGGVYAVRDSSPAGWAAIGGPWYYATFASLPAVGTIKNLQVVCGDVGYGLVTLRDDGTRYRPVGRSCVLASACYGTIASPTNGRSTAGQFPIGTPTFPANLFAVGDMFIFNVRAHKVGGNATVYLRACIGTAGDINDSNIWDVTQVATTLSQSNGDAFICIGSATSQNSNRGIFLSGSTGQAGAAIDGTANFNIASEMKLSIGVGAINASDTSYLLGYSLEWRT